MAGTKAVYRRHGFEEIFDKHLLFIAYVIIMFFYEINKEFIST